MREKKNTCPVCFTKMHTQNNVLVCPECGYKLCDHSYAYHDSYSTEHTHTPEYTTASKTSSFAPTGTSAPTNSGYEKKAKLTGRGKIVLLLIIIYIGLPVLSIILSAIFSLLSFFINAFFRL